MTEEELKDKICVYVHNLHKVEPFNGFTCRDLRDVAEHFALPREKRIAELTEQNTSLLTSVENLNKSVQELEAQIEKMKADVKQGQSYWNSGEMQYDLYQRLLDKWEIKEK